MKRRILRLSLLTIAICCGLIFQPAIFQPAVLQADILKPGYKNVTHELVFRDTPFIAEHKLVAAPISGFHGVVEIKAQFPFPFSTKYGTKIYLVPEGEPLPTAFDRDVFKNYQSWEPPLSETSSVPASSTVAQITTTIQFVGTGVEDAKLEVAEQVETDRFGNVAKPGNGMLWFSLFCAAGLAACLIAIRKMKKSQRRSAEAAEHGEVLGR